MTTKKTASVILQNSVRLLMICQLSTLCGGARGQIFIPPQSLTIPAETFDQSSEPLSATATRTTAADFELTVRTDLLARFVNRESVRSNPVATQVMEANVTGYQTTTTNVQLQSANSSDRARLDVLTQGTVSSNTIGLTPQARISTLGNHTFNVTKPVFFDGANFLTKSAYGSLQVRQYPQAIDTVASGLPLIGRIGNRVAWNEVQRRMPATDAIVVRQVADDVIPKVNAAVDSQLSDLNRNWQSLRRTLDRLSGSDTIQWNASSTSESFSTNATNRSVRNRSGDVRVLSADLGEPEDLVLLVSQEGINRTLAQLPLAGLTVSDATLRQLGAWLKDARNDPSQLQALFSQLGQLKQEPLLFSVKFAEVEPLSLTFVDDWLTIRIMFQIVPKVGEPGLMQLVSVRLVGEPEQDGNWSIAVNKITAEPASRNAEPDLYTNMINNPAIVSQIPATTLPRNIDLRKYHEKMPLFRLHRIQSRGGQLRISVRAIDSAEGGKSVRRFP